MTATANPLEAELKPTALEKLLNAYQRRRGGLESALERWSGKWHPRCAVCRSEDVQIDETGIALINLRVPKRLHRYLPELRRRDNGHCRSCGLVQSFYRLSEPTRRALYAEPFESLGANETMRHYPFTPAWVRERNTSFWGKRLPKWDAFLRERGITRLARVLHIRADLGATLPHFHDTYGAEVYASEWAVNFRRHIEEHYPYVTLVNGNLGDPEGLDVGGRKFDFIVCFHTLAHSIDPLHELEMLTRLLAEHGHIVFCDEISRKYHNTFHQMHFSEQTFRNTLAMFFQEIVRVDDAGPACEFTAGETAKHDNPDWIVSAPIR
jgi:SAM-dependent methyltransferase